MHTNTLEYVALEMCYFKLPMLTICSLKAIESTDSNNICLITVRPTLTELAAEEE